METTPPIQSVPRISGMEILILAVLALCAAVSALVWKKGSDRAGCIMNIRNAQQAVRGHQGMNNLSDGTSLNLNDIFGPSGYLPQPVCPAGGTYTFTNTIPAVGTGKLFCKCSHANHVPTHHESPW
jgi:hypothetical protein